MRASCGQCKKRVEFFSGANAAEKEKQLRQTMVFLKKWYWLKTKWNLFVHVEATFWRMQFEK
jgi:hypothetical protein